MTPHGPQDDVQHEADDRFVHALLTGHLGDAREDLERRVQRVAAALDDPHPRPLPTHVTPRPARRSMRGLGVVLSGGLAAAILITLFATLVAPRTAQAGFQRVVDAVAHSDQTYAIEVVSENGAPLPPSMRRPAGRLSRLRPALAARLLRRSAESLDGGTLYVRGESFVLVRNVGPFELVQGYDQGTRWRVHPRDGSVDRMDGEPLRLPPGVSELLFVDVQDLVARAAEDYALQDHGLVAGEEGVGALRRYTGERRDRGHRLPRTLELYVEEETGQPVELYLSGLRPTQEPGTYEVRLRLVGTEPLPADWFTPEAHGN